jgi:hypothetical protein
MLASSVLLRHRTTAYLRFLQQRAQPHLFALCGSGTSPPTTRSFGVCGAAAAPRPPFLAAAPAHRRSTPLLAMKAAGTPPAASPGGARRGNSNSNGSAAPPPPDAALLAKAARIGGQLAALYPDPGIPLEHRSNFQLLVAVMLSAQARGGWSGGRVDLTGWAETAVTHPPAPT